MGEVVSIFADGRLHRQFLDRITKLELTSRNGCLFLRLTATGDVDYYWITGHVTFRFIVDGGKKIMISRCWGLGYFTTEENTYYARIEFRDPKTGREEPLGEWETLEIVFVAGKEEKSFTDTKKGKEGATPKPEIKGIS